MPEVTSPAPLSLLTEERIEHLRRSSPHTPDGRVMFSEADAAALLAQARLSLTLQRRVEELETNLRAAQLTIASMRERTGEP